MSQEAVELYEPIQTLKPVADDIWIADGPIVHMAMYGAAIPFPTRMTLVRLAGGALWVHSPITMSSTLKTEIDALGPVRHLVSPNKIHYTHIAPWSRLYPEAIAWASPGVYERAASQNIEVVFHADLSDEAPPAWSAEIDQLIFRGSRFMDEVVFFHRQSRTLILTDLIENFEAEKVSGVYRQLIQLAGCLHPDGKAPLDLRATFWGRKNEARACLERMLAWAPERIILAHGRWYDRDGTQELRRAFRWLDPGRPTR